MAGTIAQLWRYPVKSMPGERIAEAEVDGHRAGASIARSPTRCSTTVWMPTPRCSVPTLAQRDLPRDVDALRVLAAHNRIPALPGRTPEPCAGAYAQVVNGGRIREGDPVVVER